MPSQKQSPFTPNPHDLLIAEYNFVSGLVFQSGAEEIPKEVFNFDIATFAGIAIGIIGGQYVIDPSNLPLVNFGLAVYFFWLAIRGLMTEYILARKRSEWHENLIIHNRIKDFYIQHNQSLAPAITIRTSTIPRIYSPYSVSFILAIQVALFSGGALSLAIYLTLAGFGYLGGQVIAIIFGIAFFLFLTRLYKYLLTINL